MGVTLCVICINAAVNTFLNVTAQPKYLFCDTGMRLYYNFIHCIFNICILSFFFSNPR